MHHMQAPEGGKFLKGLSVVNDVAYFGVSVFAPRSARQDPEVDSELAAFDLVAGELLWRRIVPTKGLLNVVSAPHLGEASTYRAMGMDLGGGSSSRSRKQLSDGTEAQEAVIFTKGADTARKDLMSNGKVLAASQQLEALGYPNKVRVGASKAIYLS